MAGKKRQGGAMQTNFILVDFENVQPKDIDLLKGGPFKVKVFLGPNQSKVPVTLAAAFQTLGGNVEYVRVETAGNNAVDFHIAYYIGVLSSQEPTAHFHIISKDRGYDPLIQHLRKRNIFAQRSTCIADISSTKPVLPSRTKPVIPSRTDAQIKVAVTDLIRRKASKPRTKKTLISTLHALFKKELSEQQISQLLAALCTRGFVKIGGTKVTYNLPGAP
jgi:PIN domain-containing protein